MKQLDLLDWNPPCMLIAFPMAKRIGKIRRVAEVLSARRGAAATNYWKQMVATMGGQMQRAGFDRDTINRELREFHDAVQRELWLRSGHGQRPGGSAA
ncbi:MULTISPECIES: DUF6074 family protein [Mesorhizobium]|uniref:DUF6074 family protein n=1 Tax=Mesorhizobium ciceri TaxID=39645 RepID=A0AB38T5K7_9HYPH|nr:MULTISPECIES: DUF6074 family protein [Mesorhizobium]MDF3216277.1 DUF6074 family protein [Mesorhizobium ciceri]UTU49853.1 DUF6074 family protein [Mesorhizobium ciceri]